MLQLSAGRKFPNKPDIDTWQDSAVRSNLAAAASFVEAGANGSFGPTSAPVGVGAGGGEAGAGGGGGSGGGSGSMGGIALETT